MDTLAQAIRNLGPTRLAVMGGVFIGLIGFFIFLTTRLASPSMAVLYGDLEGADSNQITTQLTSMNIPYSLKLGGSQILVPSDQVSKARLSLANQGLPSGGTIGFEIFDKSDSLGTTNFMQNVTLVRAMEGELSRTIQSIDNVKTARVHLVMPKRELFSREKQEPTASVVLGMKSAGRLGEEQISAVKHLVATAVPGLSPERISIIDNKGKLLAGGAREGTGANALSLKADARRRGLELRLGDTIEQLLERSIGFGKVRAEVTVDMDFDRISTQSEEYNPDGQVVRSTQSTEESSDSNDSEGADAVSIGTNLPDGDIDGGDSQSSSDAQSRTEEIVNYEISKKVINHVREAGIIKRISVAVLVDGKRTKDADGNSIYEPRDEAEMDLIATLVRGTIGFDADRGDSVEVINMEFVKFEEPEIELKLFFGLDKNDMMRLAEVLVLCIIAILVILLVIRPLVSRAFETMPSASDITESLMAEGAHALSGPGMSGVPAPGDFDEEEEEHFEELIDIDRVEGRVKASSVKKVGEIVSKHPEESLSIIRSWMYQET